MTFVNRIAQKSVAPFGLVGEMSGDDLQLKWQSPEHSTVLGYVPDGAEMTAMRMTGNSTIKSYCASKFPRIRTFRLRRIRYIAYPVRLWIN